MQNFQNDAATTDMKWFKSFAVSAAVLAFFLAVLGSWVRINGAGMTCPDWPLCNGSLIPRFTGGVIWEWLHRLIALIEGVVLIGAVVTGYRVRKQIAGVGAALVVLGFVFAVQVMLGGITVQLSNRPDSVVYHWAAAMALLSTLTTLATLAILRPSARPQLSARTGWLIVAAVSGLVAMCAGAYVSSSGAGLACSGLPGCGRSFWGGDVLQRAQMIHRAFAALFFATGLTATLIALRARSRGAVAATLGLGLICLQIALGIANVIYFLPIALREAHAANAAAAFLSYVAAAVLEALDMTAPNAESDAVSYSESLQGALR